MYVHYTKKNMIKGNYKIIFHFDNNKYTIIEIKKTNVISQDVSKIYQWLLYDKNNDMLSKLQFKSMVSAAENKGTEIREFEEGKLSFDQNSATYSENGKREVLEVKSTEKSTLPKVLSEAIEDLLLLDRFRKETL